MPNLLTETHFEFKARKFNQGKIDGFAEACELVEWQYGWLTRDVFSILLLWRVYVVNPLIRLNPELSYMLGYSSGLLSAHYYLCWREVAEPSRFGLYLFELGAKLKEQDN